MLLWYGFWFNEWPQMDPQVLKPLVFGKLRVSHEDFDIFLWSKIPLSLHNNPTFLFIFMDMTISTILEQISLLKWRNKAQTPHHLCMHMFSIDFNKRFLVEIILIAKNYSCAQRLDYDYVSFHCKASYKKRYITTLFPKHPMSSG